MTNSNVELLTKVAKRLGPLLREVVFVGGCTTALLITDEAAAEVRPTFDVDVIAKINTYAGYAAFFERLRALGFREDSSKGAPLSRWLIDAIKLDVMPLKEKILGFTNRWYRAAMEAAQEIAQEPELRIRVVTAPYFVATKLEACSGRGSGDYAGSHDLEELLTVIDGRAAIVQEIANVASVRLPHPGQNQRSTTRLMNSGRCQLESLAANRAPRPPFREPGPRAVRARRCPLQSTALPACSHPSALPPNCHE
jgi:hypothetical protein